MAGQNITLIVAERRTLVDDLYRGCLALAPTGPHVSLDLAARAGFGCSRQPRKCGDPRWLHADRQHPCRR